MAYTSGEASSAFDLLAAIDKLLIQVGWTRVVEEKTTEYDNTERLSYAIWEGVGGGTDKIYIQGRINGFQKNDRIKDESGNKLKNIANIYLDSCIGFDKDLYFFEQAGSIQQWNQADGDKLVKQPIFTGVGNEKYVYWLFADSYRIIGIARIGVNYESFHMGFLNPIVSERQYPYPMYVCGNGNALGKDWIENIGGSIVAPREGSGYLRRADGTWREFTVKVENPDYEEAGTIFPYNALNKKLIPNFKGSDTVVQDNYLLIPVMLQTNNPIDMCGIMRDVYWISGTKDVASEATLVYNGDSYMIFDTQNTRGNNSYFCIKMV